MALQHSQPGQVIDVAPLGARLREGKTSALFKAGQLELARIVLRAGESMREHQAPGEITLQCLEGLLELTTPTGSQLLRPGQLIHLLKREPHALKAIEDSSALLTMCLRTL
ncbi:MAG: cupin domain-containing protein [Ideonella sp.]|nr:cupin domain-containing protein [Ideonella sp.]MBL0149090.1 cupin domain-containing protein [Ideonella sp.]